jgi:hypothetical protein
MPALAFVNHADDQFGCGEASESRHPVLGIKAETEIRCGRRGLTG